MHFIKLLLRSVLFFGATILYLITRINKTDDVFGGYEKVPWLLALIWMIYTIEMAFRFFPSKIESPGCQKQFAKNYKPTGEKTPQLQSWKRTFSVAVAVPIAVSILGILQALQYGEYVNWSLYGIEGEEAEIQELKAAATNVDKFLDIAYKYTDLQELTPEVLRTFIAKVVIHERSDKWSKSAEQQIDIYFRYIGNLTVQPVEQAG